MIDNMNDGQDQRGLENLLEELLKVVSEKSPTQMHMEATREKMRKELIKEFHGKTMENSYRRMVNMCLVLAELVEQDHETFPMKSVLSQQIAFAGLLEMLGEDLLFILEPKNFKHKDQV